MTVIHKVKIMGLEVVKDSFNSSPHPSCFALQGGGEGGVTCSHGRDAVASNLNCAKG